MKFILFAFLGFPILLFSQKKSNLQESNQFISNTWIYSTNQSSLILSLLSSKKNDTIFLNYIVTSKKYIAGDEGQILGWISKKKFYKEYEIITEIKNADNLLDSFRVSIRFNKRLNAIFWKVLSHCDSNVSLFIINKAMLHKAK